MNRDPQRLRENVEEAISRRLPEFQWQIRNRGPETRKATGGYDIGALEDYRLGPLLSLYVTMEPREKIVEICRATTYGRYDGKPKLNHHVGIVCRMVRAYFLEDEDWLREEVELLKTKACGGDMPNEFYFYKTKWHPWFYSLFFGDRESFEKAFIAVVKAYKKRASKYYVDENGNVSPHSTLNTLALMTLKIANAYRGYNVAVDDPFVPMELLCLD